MDKLNELKLFFIERKSEDEFNQLNKMTFNDYQINRFSTTYNHLLTLTKNDKSIYKYFECYSKTLLSKWIQPFLSMFDFHCQTYWLDKRIIIINEQKENLIGFSFPDYQLWIPFENLLIPIENNIKLQLNQLLRHQKKTNERNIENIYFTHLDDPISVYKDHIQYLLNIITFLNHLKTEYCKKINHSFFRKKYYRSKITEVDCILIEIEKLNKVVERYLDDYISDHTQEPCNKRIKQTYNCTTFFNNVKSPPLVEVGDS